MAKKVEIRTVAYPRVYVSPKTHIRIQKIAAKQAVGMKDIGDKIVLAGIKALGY